MSLRVPVEPCLLAWLGHLVSFKTLLPLLTGLEQIISSVCLQHRNLREGSVPVAPEVFSLLHRQLGAVFFGTSHIKGNLE